MSRKEMTAEEKRQLPRISCHIQASRGEVSAPIGELADLSLDGAFVKTERPLDCGSIIPLCFSVEDSERPLVVYSEVVRVNDAGMGVRFVKLKPEDQRRLRRYVTYLVDVVGHREMAARLMASASTSIRPVTDKSKISGLFCEAEANKVTCTIIPTHKSVRERALFGSHTESQVTLAVGGAVQISSGEAIFVLVTLDFTSYSFASKVLEVDGHAVRIEAPTEVYYSERRSGSRLNPESSTRFVVRAPWKNNEEVSWPVCELGDQGLSFRAALGELSLFPGTPLPGAQLETNLERTPVINAYVRHLTTVGEGAQSWVRIGVEFGFLRGDANRNSEELSSKPVKSFGAKARAILRSCIAGVTYFYHRKLKRNKKGKASTFKVVSFPNLRGRRVVGLLNSAFDDAEKIRCPLVIVIPGFGGRKETFSAFAATLVDNFRRKMKDVAVLRIDGTNNLGESEKDTGCEADGKHCLKFTMSGTVDDLLGVLAWTRNNRFVEPTHIVIVSASFGTVAVRRVLTMPEASDVSQWFVLMGASDAQSIMLHAAGNLDIYGNFLRGLHMGVINLVGCLVDAENFCRDMQRFDVATLDDSRRDMAKIRADVTWIIGKEDALADPRRVADIMSVAAPGKREIIEVEAGHLPRNGEEALAEFVLVTRRIWRAIYGEEMLAQTPSRGWLGACAKEEWDRVYKSNVVNSVDYWRTYLLGQGDFGFDVLNFSQRYRGLVEKQIELLAPRGKTILDMGAGTGNISEAVARQGVGSLQAIDLVPEALERLGDKLPAGVNFSAVAGNVDGSPTTMLRRWLAGEISSVASFCGRLPGVGLEALQSILANYDDDMHAALRGCAVEVDKLSSVARLPSQHRDLVSDINLACQAIASGTPPASAAYRLLRQESFADPGGLPYEDATFDGVISSLVISYLNHPAETLFEVKRVLRPKGVFVLSSMKRDADTSKVYFEVLEWLQAASDDEIPGGQTREGLITVARSLSSSAAELLRIEEEGTFKFYSPQELLETVSRAGFIEAQACLSFGEPGQAVVVVCRKP